MTAPGIALAGPDADTSGSEAAGAQQSSTPSPDTAATGQTPATATLTDTAAGSTPDPTTAATPSAPGEAAVQASGGANTTVTTSDDTAEVAGLIASDTTPAALAAIAPDTADDTDKTKGTSPVTDVVDRTPPTSMLSANTVSSTANPDRVSGTARTALVATSDPAPRAAATVALISPSADPVAAPVDPITAVVTRVVSVAAGLMSFLSPSESTNPAIPVEPPIAWVVLAWARRQVEDVLFGGTPQFGFGPVTTSQSETGVVTGTISRVGPYSTPVALSVTTGPANGTVAVDPSTGEFTYTPGEALARSGGIDTFTVAATTPPDNSPWNALRDFVSAITGADRSEPATATVLVSVLPVGDTEPDPTTLDASELVGLVADGKVQVAANKNGTVRIIDGSFTDSAVRSNDDAARVINSVARLLGAPADVAEGRAITSQVLGPVDGGAPTEVIYRLQPTVNGIPTLNSQVVLSTDGQGTVTGVFSSYDGRVNGVDTTSAANLDEEAVAFAAARAALLKSLSGQNDPAAVLAAVSMASDLVIYDVDPDVAPRLARRVTVYTSVVPTDPSLDPVPVVSTDYYVYANGTDTGDVFAAISNLQDASTTWVSTSTTAKDLRNVTRTMYVQYQQSSATYRANDVVRKVSTYATSSTSTVPGTIATKVWWWGWDPSAVSAQANTEVVWDYYRNNLSRTSFDGIGSAVRTSVLPNSFNNAYWDPSLRTLVFGHDTEAALDVVGHEFTHGVINYAVANGKGLLYQKESGALNESYADIMGSLIENKTGTGKWLIAEDYGCGYSSCAIRDMSKPSRYGQPENYAKRYTGTADYGGVHTNSGIFNFAAYKMMVDTRTTGVSTARWAKVFYGSLFKLSSNATFLDARAAVLSSAKSQGFTTSQLQAITDAFVAVGIK